MKLKFIIFIFFLMASFPIIRVQADWKINAINIFSLTSTFQSDTIYWEYVYVPENAMGDELYRPILAMEIIADENDLYWSYFMWFFQLFEGSKTDWLNGMVTQLDYAFDQFDRGYAEFEVNQSGDYIMTFENSMEERYHWFDAEVFIDLWYYTWEEEPTTTTTTTTTTTITTTTSLKTTTESTTTTTSQESITNNTTPLNPVLIPVTFICLVAVLKLKKE